MARDILFNTPGVLCRLIDRHEREVLEEAAAIDREAWGDRLAQDAEHFEARAANGFLVGAFKGDELVGTISAVRRPFAMMEAARNDPNHPFSTWDGISCRGTFAHCEPMGDALFCVAVSSRGASPRRYPEVPTGTHKALELARELSFETDTLDEAVGARAAALAAATIDVYAPLDPVMRFHMKPKGGGILPGARILWPIPRGRPADTDAMGYNLLMAYPELVPGATFPDSVSVEVSVGEALILAAAALGSRLGVRLVVPYSRPGAFRYNLIKALVAIGTGAPASLDPFQAAVRKFIESAT